MTATLSSSNHFGSIGGIGGIGRMSDEDYETEFKTDTTATGDKMRLAFSQAAKQHAAENKKRITSKTRSVYRMAANSRVNRAFQELDAKLQKQRQIQEDTPAAMPMSESDFQLLKQAIENFEVRLIVHDSTTLSELKEQRTQATNEMADIASTINTIASVASAAAAESADSGDSIPKYVELIISYKEKESDMKDWVSALATEIRRIDPSSGCGYRESPPAPAVPSQHVQIANSSGKTLRDILSPETIRRRFISLHTLTQAIRKELLEFLTDECRRKDRAEVVQQIKNSCLAAKTQKQC
jgi:hypothetical protein